MKINKLVVNVDEEINFPGTNCYIVSCTSTKETIVIDSGCSKEEAENIFKEIEEHNLKVKYIFTTHGHVDHFCGNKFLKNLTKADLLIHEADNFLLQYDNWLKMNEGMPKTPCMRCGEVGQFIIDVDHEREVVIGLCKKCGPLYEYSGSPPGDWLLKDGDELTVGDLIFKVIHTPGHSKGGSCLYYPEENVLFSGDTLLAEGHGWVGLPYGSMEEMKVSLAKLMQLPEETKILPGHGEETTIGEVKKILIQ